MRRSIGSFFSLTPFSFAGQRPWKSPEDLAKIAVLWVLKPTDHRWLFTLFRLRSVISCAIPAQFSNRYTFFPIHIIHTMFSRCHLTGKFFSVKWQLDLFIFIVNLAGIMASRIPFRRPFDHFDERQHAEDLQFGP